jgi:hypothetical protein
MAVERRKKTEKPKTYTVTIEDLYKAACTKSEPCGAHMKSVDQMIKRLEKRSETMGA